MSCFLVMASSASTACSVLFGVDDLSGGAPSPSDGASADVLALDVSPLRDAGDAAPGDAGRAPDASFDCTAPDTFCDTFERTDPKGGWTNVSQSNGGTALIATGDAAEGTRYLRAQIPERLVDPHASATLTLSLPAVRSFVVEQKLRVDTFPASGKVAEIVSFFGTNPAGTSQVVFSLRSSGTYLGQTFYAQDGGANVTVSADGPVIAASKWVTMVLVVDLVARKVTVSLDGVPGAPLTLSPDTSPTEISFREGIQYTSVPNSAISLGLDDVRLRYVRK
ncbi:MAG: hypothetical protein HOO96_36410 [Polyangiaceae bacterium]|nr:hypothetical protein [Polyangiaceae bacterium]